MVAAQPMDSVAILERLIAFPTVSLTPNDGLIAWVRGLLEDRGVPCRIVGTADGQRSCLFASIGPADRPGLMLSGHSDVVPADTQDWSVDPFTLTRKEGRYYGRGTADMKGFVACAIRVALAATGRRLRTPLHLALSYDEEIGCVGIRPMLELLQTMKVRPKFCIVGEPTSLAIAIGHKGKTALAAHCTGRSAHSAFPQHGLNAIHLAADMIGCIRRRQEELEAGGARDDTYAVPYSTLHVGLVQGGTALNIVPERCRLDLELRALPADSVRDILARLEQDAADIVARHRPQFAEADIRLETVNAYPGLDTPEDSAVVTLLKSLTGANSVTKASFGTEGGLIHARLGVPTVICGPGSMDQGHKPDEYISCDQLAGCDALLDRLLDRLVAGL